MRTAYVIATMAMLAAVGMSRARAEEPQHDAHHPAAAADSGAPMPVPSPDAMTAPPDLMPPAPGAARMMSPEMARMMPTMMKDMCAMMLSDTDTGKGMMANPQGPGMAMEGPRDPVTGAFDAINRRMHQGMSVDASGGADRAFAEAMIAHHQGAIDMAKVILAFGSDARIRTLAEQIIKAQESEVTFLRQWLNDQPAN